MFASPLFPADISSHGPFMGGTCSRNWPPALSRSEALSLSWLPSQGKAPCCQCQAPATGLPVALPCSNPALPLSLPLSVPFQLASPAPSLVFRTDIKTQNDKLPSAAGIRSNVDSSNCFNTGPRQEKRGCVSAH